MIGEEEQRTASEARSWANVTTKAPADVVDGATGVRRKMMRAQLRGACRY